MGKIQKICIFSFYNQYESKRYFAKALAKSLEKQAIAVLLMEPLGGRLTPEVNKQVELFSPDVTLSFNTLLPDPLGNFLWDYSKIPHLSVLLDPAMYALGLDSPYGIFSTVDRSDCHWLQAECFAQAFFWPHAVEADLPLLDNLQRQMDVVFLGTCIDYEGLEAEWLERFKPRECAILQQAIERMWQAPLCSLGEALIDSIQSYGDTIDMSLFQLLFIIWITIPAEWIVSD